MLREKFQALIEGHWVRVGSAHIFEAHAGRGDQIVHDSNVRFGDDAKLVLKQMIVILVHGAVQGILDGDDGGVDLAGAERSKHLVEAGEGNYLRAVCEQLADRLLAKSAELALKTNAGFLHSG
jgi:hypothetical protein